MNYPKIEIGQLCTITSGGTPSRKKSNYFEGGSIPWIKTGDLKKQFVQNATEYITKEGLKNSSAKLFPKETVLLAMYGATIGSCSILDFEATTNQACAALLPSKKLIPAYLFYYFKAIKTQLISLGVGGAQPNISGGIIKKLKIPLPPLPVQERIAEILDAADALRQKDQQLLEKYDQLAQSIFLDMFGDPVTNPKGWEKVKLSEITKITSGSTPSREHGSNYIGSIPWVKTGEVKGGKIMKTVESISEKALENSSCRLYPIGSIIIAMYGQGITRGKVAILGIEATTNQACAVLPPSDKINYTFLLRQLSEMYEDLRKLGRGGNQPNLNIGLIKKYQIINPPNDLQTCFEEKISSIEKQKKQSLTNIKKSESLFQSLLQKAFKGELVDEAKLTSTT